MRRTLIILATALASAPAAASEYRIEDVKQSFNLTDDDVARLKAQGVSTTLELHRKAPDARGAKALARSAKVDPQKIEPMAAACDVMRIRGVGPEVSRILAAVGVRTAATLAREKAADLSARIEAANEKLHLTEKTPSVGHLAAWIDQAQALAKPK